MEDKQRDIDFSLSFHAIRIVAESHCASKEEIEQAIVSINKIIGTGYYDDPDGDVLLETIVKFLKSKI
jgi:hypothetical protein